MSLIVSVCCFVNAFSVLKLARLWARGCWMLLVDHTFWEAMRHAERGASSCWCFCCDVRWLKMKSNHVDGECIGGVRTEVGTAYASAIVYVSVDNVLIMISPVLHLHRMCFVDLYCILELSRSEDRHLQEWNSRIKFNEFHEHFARLLPSKSSPNMAVTHYATENRRAFQLETSVLGSKYTPTKPRFNKR